ncbi:MAG: hypothetical protein H0S79_22455, partial [Anaerolineaceae bacterium]|nr:hypothetical protein [Anaerolineaceae bacterium]
MIVSGIIALVIIILMVLSAGRFSASQAAHETKAQVADRELRRYGFSAQVRARRVQKRLGAARRAHWQPEWTGASALIWKDVLGTWRGFDISYFYRLMTFMGVGLGLVFIPTLGGRIILILTWALQASKFLTSRLREDLTHWTITRQQPFRPMNWILADLGFSSLLILFFGLLGMLGGAALGGQLPLAELLSLPGMIFSMAGASAAVIFRHARIDLLMAGQTPGINEFGVLLVALTAGVPVVIYSIVPGWLGVLFGVMASLFIAEMAATSFRKAYMSIE